MSQAPGDSRRKPNVILIMADQLRADALSCMGSPIVRTPNLDRIAAGGVVFQQAFTNCPVCMAARGAIHTGRYPRSLRMPSMGILPPEETTLAESLKRAGYRTGLFGKLHFTPMSYTLWTLKDEHELDDVTPFLGPAGVRCPATLAAVADPFKKHYGFDVSFGVADSTWGHYLDWLERVSPEHVKHHVSENWGNPRGGVSYGASPPAVRMFHPAVGDFFDSNMPAELHPSRFIVDRAIEFIRDNASVPFFAHVSFVDPHHPFNAPRPFSRMYDPAGMPIPPRFDAQRCYPSGLPEGVLGMIRKRQAVTDEAFQWALADYFGMVANIDDCVGRLLDELSGLGLIEDTILLFISDHGEHVGDHRLLYKGSLLFDSLMRVPLLVSWGRGFAGGRRVDAMVQTVDVYPTVMSLLNLPIPGGVQGRDLAPMLKGQAGEGAELVLCELDDLPDRQYVATLALRSRDWKLIYYPGAATGMLFDLRNDPAEYRNLFLEPSAAKARDEMMMRLVDQLHRTKDPLPVRLSQA